MKPPPARSLRAPTARSRYERRSSRSCRQPSAKTERKWAIAASVNAVAVYFGSTPAVCRVTNIDPRACSTATTRVEPSARRSIKRAPPPISPPEGKCNRAAVLDLIETRSRPR
jgi:hypothetical protein